MKKTISIILTMTMMVLTTLTANATQKNVFGGVISPTAEQQAEYEASLTETDLRLIEEKIAAAKEFSKQASTRAATKISIPGSFTMYRQETGYYCVPACIKSALRYLTGTIYSQDDIADAVGTTTEGTYYSQIAPYMNQQQDFYYVTTTNITLAAVQDFPYYTVANHGTPVFFNFHDFWGEHWAYPTTGHCVLINAVYSDKSKVQFADPMGGVQSNYPTFYEKIVDEVYDHCTAIVW